MTAAYPIKSPRKLIELALPLDAIVVTRSPQEHSHSSTRHLWWARSPLATSSVVMCTHLVSDPATAKIRLVQIAKFR